MAENNFEFGHVFTPTDGKTKASEYPACQYLYKQVSNSETAVNITSQEFSVKETYVIQGKENISNSNNSAQIGTSKEDSCSESLTNISDTANYLCYLCSKRYKAAGRLKIHMESIHRIGDYECRFCRKIFAFANQFNIHTERHLNVHTRPYNCSICQSSFKTKIDVVHHKNKVHSGKKFECNFCYMVYSSRSGFLYHQSVDHKVGK